MIEIDARLVKQLVSTQFPRWAELPVVPVEHDGWDNRTFRLGDRMSALPGRLARHRSSRRSGSRSSLSVYDTEARRSIATLAGDIDGAAVTEVWDTALATSWQGPPVSVHGDVAATNLLVKSGRLAAVIDFGSSGIGDPSCDLVVAWTFLDQAARTIFRSAAGLDPATWQRARGWAIWKAMITLVQLRDANPIEAQKQRRIIRDVLDDHSRASNRAS